MKQYTIENLKLKKYIFFTGKGGVGKTSTACATAVGLADSGKKVLLISTDPASNLQDVFKRDISGDPTDVGVNNLKVINIDPLILAKDYKESVVAPFRGVLPNDVVQNMEEQLSGSCTVEIATFNEFTKFLTDATFQKDYDFILFDTAPTGHTLRMLELPSAWSDFISEAQHGTSCMGQFSGLKGKQEQYAKAVKTLTDKNKSLFILVTRADKSPLDEASRASKELIDLNIQNQILVVNAYLEKDNDETSRKLKLKQDTALKNKPKDLKSIDNFYIPLRSYNVIGLESIRNILKNDMSISVETKQICCEPKNIKNLVDEFIKEEKKVIFTMGKGGVGKTTIAATLALALASKGKKVYVASTDPAHHIDMIISSNENITVSYIDEKEELRKYQEEVIAKAKLSMSEADLDYVKEDLRSPCTQEIAVFRAFAEIVEKAQDHIVVIDTAPSGHTLLLLDATQSYHKEVDRTLGGNIPDSVRNLLPRLRNPNETSVVMVTLPEATPVYEALRLEDDLKRAGIAVSWWIVNNSFYNFNLSSNLFKSRANNEVEWIDKVSNHTNGKICLIQWYSETIDDVFLSKLIG